MVDMGKTQNQIQRMKVKRVKEVYQKVQVKTTRKRTIKKKIKKIKKEKGLHQNQ